MPAKPVPANSWNEFAQFCPQVYPALRPACQELIRHVRDLDRAAARRSRRPARLRVAFVGRFKTGKSRLINALLGHSVLPSDTDECTAHLVMLYHRKQPRAFQWFSPVASRGKSWTRIWFDDFLASVDATRPSRTRAASPDVLERFLVGVPCEPLKGLCLMDTPGYDGTNAGSRARADEAIKHAARWAEVCVLVLSGPPTHDDVAVAARLRRHGSALAVVLNKSDKFDDEQLDDVRRCALGDLADVHGRPPSWFLVSASAFLT